jgi:acetyl-CoA carboxylase carboxyltransferase component
MSELQKLRDKKAHIQAGGGEKGITSQHSKGKLTARERLNILFDEDTFVEMDTFVKHRCTNFGMDKTEVPGEGVVTGYGRVDGRMVYAFAQDFTVLGGSLGEYHAEKIVKVQDYALQNGCPIVGLLDSGGARIQEGVNSLFGFGKIFYRNTISSGVIPQQQYRVLADPGAPPPGGCARTQNHHRNRAGARWLGRAASGRLRQDAESPPRRADR